MDIDSIIYQVNCDITPIPTQRKYDSLKTIVKYKVNNLEYHESEYGWRVVVFFNRSTNYIYLPPSTSKKFVNKINDFIKIKQHALNGKLQFQFTGWDEFGQARFHFSTRETEPASNDKTTTKNKKSTKTTTTTTSSAGAESEDNDSMITQFGD